MSFALAGRLAVAQRWVDPLTARLQPLIRQAVSPRPARNFLDGVWLGTPLHPALTTSRSAPKSGELCTLADTRTPLRRSARRGGREGDTIICPWHGSCFDLHTGAVLRVPARSITSTARRRRVSDS
jgi:hypothetical protein